MIGLTTKCILQLLIHGEPLLHWIVQIFLITKKNRKISIKYFFFFFVLFFEFLNVVQKITKINKKILTSWTINCNNNWKKLQKCKFVFKSFTKMKFFLTNPLFMLKIKYCRERKSSSIWHKYKSLQLGKNVPNNYKKNWFWQSSRWKICISAIHKIILYP